MRTLATILALTAVLAAGCDAPITTALLPRSQKQKASEELDADPNGPRAAALRKANGQQPLTHEEALGGILLELQEIRAIDPEAERQLKADLKEANPEHYPMIVDAFRTALAFRQQLAERQRTAENESFALASHESPAASRDSIERASAVQASLAEARAARTVRPPTQTSTADEPARESYATDELMPSFETVALRPAPASRALTPLEPQSNPEVNPAAFATDHNPYLSPPGAQATTASTSDWHVELTRSIADLEKTVAPKPTNVAELHDHMRLRTLQLLAGRQEEAFRPIPGASADQQDYWSKQLFAMSAYLDSGGKLDDKQRAAAALSALDEARAKLSELSTLQIRNAAFVTSVDGFGAYEPSKTKSFQPGEKVTLYAEVENFRSSADEDGYHTSLATSYQVLDSTGRRVDGKQFPDVADRCRNRRRDFHMQYELPLPTRIYPGEYVLELTITDHNSGKIGQATLPFEIGGDQ